MFLAIIRGQNGDLFRWVTNQPHVHKSGHNEFGLGQILIEKRAGRRFADSVEILNIDQLEVVAKSSVGLQIARGVEEDRITAKGYGKLNPKYDNKTKQGRQLNRRVEIKSVGPYKKTTKIIRNRDD